MAIKLRELLSELATDIKSINLDDRISFRYLHSKFNSKIAYFLRLEARSREIIKDTTIWKEIKCIELEEVNLNECGYIDECNTLKRSKEKIPEAFNTNYGQLIQVMTKDGKKQIPLIQSNTYTDYINRPFPPKGDVAWIENKYLYIPNTEKDFVKILIIPKNPLEIDILNKEVSSCTSVLDSYIYYPEYLITLAKQEVLKELSSIYKRMIEDEKGDENTNIKN